MADMTVNIEAWEQLKEEPTTAFIIFQRYLHMKPKRVISLLAQQEELTTETLYNYKQKYNWEIRAESYDRYISEIEQREYEKMIKETCARHAKLAENLQSILMIPAKVFADKIKDIGEKELKEMHTSDLLAHVYQAAKLIKPLIEVERLSKGLSNDHSNVKTDLRTQIQINVNPVKEGEVVIVEKDS